ncbi:hypothetical protein [Legionella sp. WA2022007384]
MINSSPLKISAFKDIVSFILETGKNDLINIKYVKDANEAHSDLKDKKADVVFMSYDDTLSMVLQENYPHVAAIMPVHGGILDLCGRIDLKKNTIITGIDTPTGYARLLRLYLMQHYPEDYEKFDWVLAGATNLRYEQLKHHLLDITLLNPPFSYDPSLPRIECMMHFSGGYQGVVANINKTNYLDSNKRITLKKFIYSYYQKINEMKKNAEKTILELTKFYQISLNEAKLIYERLWAEDGLNEDIKFEESALQHTEQIFTQDTGIKVPAKRIWVVHEVSDFLSE